jgi:hypothetical protein
MLIKHTPEKQLIMSFAKHVPKTERKMFLKEYSSFRNNYCIVLKKRTGKGSEWHISLNPRKLKEIIEIQKDGNLG